MIQICKEKVLKYAIICIILHFIKCVFFFFLNHTFTPNKILNILSKTKNKNDKKNLKLLGNLKMRIQIKKKLNIYILDYLKLPTLKKQIENLKKIQRFLIY
jgi:hypothetical protein